MQFFIRILLLTALLAATAYCQGGGGEGGGGGGGGFWGGGYYGGRGSLCSRNRCRLAGIIVGSVLGGIVGMVLLVVGVCCCCKHYRGKPRRSNSVFVINTAGKSNEQDMNYMKLFHSGFWTSRYFQYNRWHEPHHLLLSFDPQALTVSGLGTDDVGTFYVDGTYSPKTHRLGLTKTYQLDTENPSESLGHKVTIQLEWNSNESQFEGKWYVKTHKFHEEDIFELKSDRQQKQLPILPVYERL